MSNDDKSQWEPLSFRDISQKEDNILIEKNTGETANSSDKEQTDFTDSIFATEVQEGLHGEHAENELHSDADLEKEPALAPEAEYARGYELGRQDGYEQGYQIGQQDGVEKIHQALQQQMDQEKMVALQTILDLVSNFQKSITDLDDVIVSRLANLAMLAAKKMVSNLPAETYQQLIITIKELISQFPILGKDVRLYVNPDDIESLQESLSNELAKYNWHLIPDPSIELGGCRIVTDQNEIDATIASKFQVMDEIVNKGDH